jgi:hypothetical protein
MSDEPNIVSATPIWGRHTHVLYLWLLAVGNMLQGMSSPMWTVRSTTTRKPMPVGLAVLLFRDLWFFYGEYRTQFLIVGTGETSQFVREVEE